MSYILYAPCKGSLESPTNGLAQLPCQSVNQLHLLLYDLHLVLVSWDSIFLFPINYPLSTLVHFILGVGVEDSICWPLFTSNMGGLKLGRENHYFSLTRCFLTCLTTTHYCIMMTCM
jgi:hypothetical protein